ncbi:MAG: aminopeptidase [Candidatus Woesearchaeota archaeon]
MNEDSLLQFLKKKSLLTVAKRYKRVFEKVLSTAIGVRKGEVLIISDWGSKERRVAPIMTGSYLLAAESVGCKVNVIMQNPRTDGSRAEPCVVQGMKQLKDRSTVILNSSNKAGMNKALGKNYRRFLNFRGCKFATTPGLGSLKSTDIFNIISPFDIDYRKMKIEAMAIKKKLDFGRNLTITTKTGTSLDIDIRGKNSIAIDGNYNKFPSGGNMPPGEVYLAPGKVNGKLVIDGSSRVIYGTMKIEQPITLKIRNGIVLGVEGGSEARMLKLCLSSAMKRSSAPSNVKRIGEVGIGLNPKAKIYGAMVIDEKALGTAHLALGSNSWFGGDIHSILHLDQVFKNPEIKIDNKLLDLPRRKDLL